MVNGMIGTIAVIAKASVKASRMNDFIIYIV
jgi:hypothetical protein